MQPHSIRLQARSVTFDEARSQQGAHPLRRLRKANTRKARALSVLGMKGMGGRAAPRPWVKARDLPRTTCFVGIDREKGVAGAD